MPEFQNAMEPWSLYDTILIGTGQSGKGPGWLDSYLDLGNQNKISFFNVRTRSQVGLPYCSMDSAQQLSFAFHCYSMGVELYAPPTPQVKLPEGVFIQQPLQNNVLFSAEMPKHMSIRMQVSQDEKLLANVEAVPSGGGFAGAMHSMDAPSSVNVYQQFGNGDPVLKNRWVFAEPVEMPRNVNISVDLKFSDWARELLKVAQGPGAIAVQAPDGQGLNAKVINAVSMIRVSMFGKREVQQRNALHF